MAPRGMDSNRGDYSRERSGWNISERRLNMDVDSCLENSAKALVKLAEFVIEGGDVDEAASSVSLFGADALGYVTYSPIFYRVISRQIYRAYLNCCPWVKFYSETLSEYFRVIDYTKLENVERDKLKALSQHFILEEDTYLGADIRRFSAADDSVSDDLDASEVDADLDNANAATDCCRNCEEHALPRQAPMALHLSCTIFDEDIELFPCCSEILPFVEFSSLVFPDDKGSSDDKESFSLLFSALWQVQMELDCFDPLENFVLGDQDSQDGQQGNWHCSFDVLNDFTPILVNAIDSFIEQEGEKNCTLMALEFGFGFGTCRIAMGFNDMSADYGFAAERGRGPPERTYKDKLK